MSVVICGNNRNSIIFTHLLASGSQNSWFSVSESDYKSKYMFYQNQGNFQAKCCKKSLNIHHKLCSSYIFQFLQTKAI